MSLLWETCDGLFLPKEEQPNLSARCSRFFTICPQSIFPDMLPFFRSCTLASKDHQEFLAYSVFFHAWVCSKVFSPLFWVISLFLFFLAKFYLFFKGFWDPHNVFACEALLSCGASFQAERTVTSFNLIKLIQYLLYWIIVTCITQVSLMTYELI